MSSYGNNMKSGNSITFPEAFDNGQWSGKLGTAATQTLAFEKAARVVVTCNAPGGAGSATQDITCTFDPSIAGRLPLCRGVYYTTAGTHLDIETVAIENTSNGFIVHRNAAGTTLDSVCEVVVNMMDLNIVS